jgi:MFS family permease
MAVSGTGALFGALGLLSVARDHRFRFMTSAVVLVALALLSMSQSSSFLLTAVSMGILAVGLSANFGLANTIVQERAPAALRGRVSAVFGLSFFGLMPIAGLLTTGLSDLIGMRTALGISAVLFGIFAVLILNVAGRTGCEKTGATVPKTEAQPAAVA